MPKFDSMELALWMRRTKDAEQEQARYHDKWKRSLKLYDMSYWEERGYKADLHDQITPVNYTTTFVSTLVAATFSRSPKIFAKPKRERFTALAQTMEKIQDNDWEENYLKEVLIEVLIDSIITNIGWVENGYLPSVNQFASRQQEEEASRTPNALTSLSAAAKRLFAKPGGDEPPSSKGYLDERMQEDTFFCLRRSPYDVLWPKGYHSYWSLPYLIVRDRTRVEDFMRNPLFKNKKLAVPEVIGKEAPKDGKISKADFSFPMSTFSQNFNDDQVVDLYTVWDRRDDRVFTFSMRSPEPHFGPEPWPYFAEGFPLIPLQFNKVPNTPDQSNSYGFSDVEPITPQVIEKSNIRTDMVDHRRRASFVAFVQKGSTTEEELNAYQSSTPMEIIPVTNLQAMQVSSPIQVPPAALQTEAAINSDLERDSGLQLILADLGRSAKIERATVASIAQGNANLKTGFRVDRIEAFAKHIARYRAQLFRQHMSRQQVGEIIGIMPSEDQWPVLPTDPVLARRRIRKELEIRLEAGSTRPIQDDVLDREQFLRWMAIFQATSPQLYKRIERDLQAEMAKKFRSPMIESLVMQATNEKEQEVAQQENQLLLQEVPQIVGDCEDHETHLKVHAAATKQGQSQALDQHLLEHQKKLEEVQAASRGAGQGVKQATQAPSASEVNQMGSPGMSDVMGTGMNLGQGSAGGLG